MTRVTPPYFFDEFLRPVRRKTPTPRERALGLTVRDLDWLHTLYYPTDEARKKPLLHPHPMHVERLLINLTGKSAITLAGAFMMSPTPDDNKAVLYTPYAGLEVFESHADLIENVAQRLRQPAQRDELVPFLSIHDREALPDNLPLTMTTAPIAGIVMEDQELAVLAAQQKNVAAMLDELRKLPSLRTMLDTVLGIMAREDFPLLDLGDTRVNFFSRVAQEEDIRWVASTPLRDALLQFYILHSWAEDQTHTFYNPGHDTTAFTQEQLAQDQQSWDRLVEQTSALLSRLLHSLLQTYWNEDINAGQSRLQFFTQVMSDKFRADLLFKHQNSILSSEECLQLRTLFLPDPAARPAVDSNLKIEKVRVQAPYQHYVDLASTLMTSDSHAYLYTQSRGLQVLEDLKDVKETLQHMFKTTGHEDELINFLSLDERSVFIGMDQVQVTGQLVVGDAFQEMVEDIAAKQLDNLQHILGQYRRSGGSIDLAALLDSALDVRAMLDSRLLEHDAGGRWSVHPVIRDSGHSTTAHAEKAKQQLQRLQTVEAALALGRSVPPTLSDLAARALDAQLSTMDLDITVNDVDINTYDSAAQEREERIPQTSVSMVEHFIERLAKQTNALTTSNLTGLYGPRSGSVAYKLPNLTIASFNAVIEQVLSTFAQDHLRTLPQTLLDDNQAHLSQGLFNGLSGEVELRRLSKRLLPRPLALLSSVLNANNMTRLNRHALSGFIPDAFSLTLKIGANAEVHSLATCFVLTERGGIDALLSGAALLWMPRHGFEAFASVKQLREVLEQRLLDPVQRLRFLENLPTAKRVPHQRYTLGPLQRIDEHLLNDRQKTYSDLIRDEIDHLLSLRVSATRFQACVDALIQRVPPSNLPRAIAMARATISQQALPVWLGMARPSEQILHAELIEQYRLSAPDERDYLHSIKPLRETVASTLRTLLEARFPEHVIDPEHILIPGRIDPKGSLQTLTDFALQHLPNMQADDIRPRSRTATALPDTLDGSAVVQLVRQLDMNRIYGPLLATHLSGQTDDSRQRRQLFYRQLPWQLLQYAHAQTLDKQLSVRAWRFIQQIFDMPDAVARAGVTGVSAIIRPLTLIATPGASLVNALGCYLIGPKPNGSGPLVLYAPYSPLPVLKEYANEAALLDEFTTPGALQDWVIGQMESVQQATYRHLLREHPRRETSEVRLGANPIAGNVLKRLFQDNSQMLTQMLESQFDTSGKSKWVAITLLLTKEIPKGLQFMAGKLAYPLAVWRSYLLFKTSAEDLQQHRWLHAMKAFAEGVAELATLRKELDRLLPDTPTPRQQPSLKEWLNAPPPTAATFEEHDLTGRPRTQLQAFENHDIVLADLSLDKQTHVYNDKNNARDYVPMAGKVYPVKKAGEHWRISNEEHAGPYVQPTAQGAWVLDLDRHHPRFGKTLSRLMVKRPALAGSRQGISIEAQGMRAIAAISPTKAQCIDEALNVATYYAVTCKRNISYFAAQGLPDSRLGRFFSEMFGVDSLDSDQLQKVERRIDEVLDELVNPTLTAPDSMRFVSGLDLFEVKDTFAFVLPVDPVQRIYLLDRFFDPGLDEYAGCLTTSFDIAAHARATTLIHEITHLRSATEDLVGLDSMRPFPDLLDVSLPEAVQMRADLDDLRQTGLSVLTPATMLFKAMNKHNGRWEDFGSGRSTAKQKNKVLNTTGGKTIEDARTIFMSNPDKRIDTILANADSITYMISQLGRVLDAGA